MPALRSLRHRLRAGLCLLLLGGGVRASDPVETPADHAWREFAEQGLVGEPTLPDNYHALSKAERYAWFEERAQTLRRQGLAFYASFPTDPRRWRIVAALLQTPPTFALAYGPKIATDGRDMTIDQAAADRWAAELARLEAALTAATDLPADLRELVASRALMKRWLQPTSGAAEFPATIAALRSFADQFPDSHEATLLAGQAILLAGASLPPATRLAAWRTLAASRHPALAQLAGQKADALALQRQPLEFSFTGLDGRAVDLAKLRGQVVVVDFWATWCAPCVAELPAFRELYAEFHGVGLEIIGIACEQTIDRGRAPGRPRRGKSLEEFRRFVEREALPWPQHYDPLEPAKSFAARHAITAYPTILVLDREGRVAATDLHGAELREKVHALLDPSAANR